MLNPELFLFQNTNKQTDGKTDRRTDDVENPDFIKKRANRFS